MASPWRTRRAISAHVAVVLLTPTFLGLGWWQLHRALSGNELSWAYTFEWPIFAAYGIWLWWRIIKDQEGQPREERQSDEQRQGEQRQTASTHKANEPEDEIGEK